jgi:histidinol-phosphate aminotransferase
MIEPKPNIRRLVRVTDRHEAPDGLIFLDKNERVSPFPEKEWQSLLRYLSFRDVGAYPRLEPFYHELAAWLEIPREWLLLTSGSEQGIRSVFEVYVRPGDTVVLPRPTFAMYQVYCSQFEAKVRELWYGPDLELSVETVLGAIAPGTRLVALPNPNSPTGTRFTQEEVGRILERATSVNAAVLIDEAYYFFYPESALSLVKEYENLILTRTFSKAAGLAGVRLGCVISQPGCIDYLRRVQPMEEIGGVSLRCGEYLLRHDHLIWEYARQANEGRAFLVEHFRSLGLRPFESHGNFVVARMPPGTDIPAFVEELRRRGYMIKGPFGDSPLTDCVRVTTGPVEIMSEFWKTFEQAFSDLVVIRKS